MLAMVPAAMAICDDTGKEYDIFEVGSLIYEGDEYFDQCTSGYIFEGYCESDDRMAFDFEPCTCADEFSCVRPSTSLTISDWLEGITPLSQVFSILRLV